MSVQSALVDEGFARDGNGLGAQTPSLRGPSSPLARRSSRKARRMRKIAAVLGLVVIVMLGSNAAAVPPAGQPQLPSPGSTVRIVAFKMVTPAPPKPGEPLSASLYRGGAVDVSVELENIGTKTATMTLRLSRGPGIAALVKTVDVPPKGNAPSGPTATATFTDDRGIVESCVPQAYSMSLEGPGADTRGRHASIVPTCSWEGKVEDEWASMPADRVDGAKKGKAYMKTVTVNTGATCLKGAQLRADVENASSKTGASLAVTAKSGDTVKGKSSPFSVPAHSLKSVTLGAGGGGGGVDVSVNLVDPTNSLASDIASRSVVVKFSRVCRLDTTNVGP